MQARAEAGAGVVAAEGPVTGAVATPLSEEDAVEDGRGGPWDGKGWEPESFR